MPRKAKTPLHAVILNKGVQRTAHALGVSVSTVHRWIEKDRIPASRITDFANLMDMSISQAMNFAIREKQDEDEAHRTVDTLSKPANTLQTLIRVDRGEMTMDEASTLLGVPRHALNITYARNKHRLFKLHTTLKAYKEERITLDSALQRLDVTRSQFYYLARKFGIGTPEHEIVTKELGRYTQARPTYQKLALDVIAGRTNVKKAVEDKDLSERTLHRYVKEAIDPHGLNELSHWPTSFRLAFAHEVKNNQRGRVEEWVRILELNEIPLRKEVPNLEPVTDWRNTPVRRLLITVLMGELTAREVATLRGGSEQAIQQLFNGVARAFGLTYLQLEAMSVLHQSAFADLLILLSEKERPQYRSRPLAPLYTHNRPDNNNKRRLDHD